MSIRLLDALVHHDCRANVRELESLLWTAMSESKGSEITEPDSIGCGSWAQTECDTARHTYASCIGSVGSKTHKIPLRHARC